MIQHGMMMYIQEHCDGNKRKHLGGQTVCNRIQSCENNCGKTAVKRKKTKRGDDKRRPSAITQPTHDIIT